MIELEMRQWVSRSAELKSMNYLKRYCNGEYEQVWDEMKALGRLPRVMNVWATPAERPGLGPKRWQGTALQN
jgi:hypothetical protein